MPMEENITPQVEEENLLEENQVLEENSEQQINTEGDKPSAIKKTRIFGIIGIITFVVLGGISYAPWFIWIAVAALVMWTYEGINKKGQIICAAIAILIGTPLIFGHDSEDTKSTTSTISSDTDGSIAGPSWIEGRWVFKGYVQELGGYQDVAIDIKRSSRQFVMVDKNLGKEVGTYKVYGNTLSTSNGTSFELDNYNHRIGLGGGLYLTKK